LTKKGKGLLKAWAEKEYFKEIFSRPDTGSSSTLSGVSKPVHVLG
jgi:hypothetical protein